MTIVQEFKNFVMRGNVVDLAVGVIIGAAFSKIIDSLVKDVLMPPIGWLIGGVAFEDLAIKLQAPGISPKTGLPYEPVEIMYGSFIQTSFEFVIIAFCLFLVIKGMNRLRGPVDAPEPPGPTPTEKLLIEIRDELRKRPTQEVTSN
jgi:large conductance mechanosensitive channel